MWNSRPDLPINSNQSSGRGEGLFITSLEECIPWARNQAVLSGSCIRWHWVFARLRESFSKSRRWTKKHCCCCVWQHGHQFSLLLRRWKHCRTWPEWWAFGPCLKDGRPQQVPGIATLLTSDLTTNLMFEQKNRSLSLLWSFFRAVRSRWLISDRRKIAGGGTSGGIVYKKRAAFRIYLSVIGIVRVSLSFFGGEQSSPRMNQSKWTLFLISFLTIWYK